MSFSNSARVICVLHPLADGSCAAAPVLVAGVVGVVFGRPVGETSHTPLMVITGVSAGRVDSVAGAGAAMVPGDADGAAVGGVWWLGVATGRAELGVGVPCPACG